MSAFTPEQEALMRDPNACTDKWHWILLFEIDRLRAKLNTPELVDFAAGVQLEAAHQRERWDSEHDAGKMPADWFWLVGYLAGKALHAHAAGNIEKAQHHTITAAAALANWHAAITGQTNMRPGLGPEAVAKIELGLLEAHQMSARNEGRVGG